jgi:hypothetical protein
MYTLSSSLLPMVVGIFPDRIEKSGVLYAFNSAFEVDVVITIFTADFFIMVILIMLLP